MYRRLQPTHYGTERPPSLRTTAAKAAATEMPRCIASTEATDTLRRQELDRIRNDLVRKRQIFESRAAMLRAEFESEQEKLQQSISESELIQAELVQDSTEMARSRTTGSSGDEKKGRAKIGRIAK